jgi:hypothetical protein
MPYAPSGLKKKKRKKKKYPFLEADNCSASEEIPRRLIRCSHENELIRLCSLENAITTLS